MTRVPSILQGLPDDLLTSDVPYERRQKIEIQPEVTGGDQAVTIQTFSELNSKTGRQYQIGLYNPALAVGANADLIIVVGDEDVIIKGVSTQFTGELISATTYKDPVYTGGTPLPYYNFNDRDAVPGTLQLLAGATVTSPGTQVGPTLTSIGAPTSGNRVQTSISLPQGAERIFPAGGTYLFRTINLSDEIIKTSTVATWYQGPISTQV